MRLRLLLICGFSRRGEEVASSGEGDVHGSAATAARSYCHDSNSEHGREVVGGGDFRISWSK
jgi:hypothetical protein